ncbi:MAG TPA: universal stress protein [Rhizomicrobium sp.]|nr:universal stress protein [Rhizomicrobium sp.]
MPQIAKILTPVWGTSQDALSLYAAFAAARPFGAHVEAFFAYPDPRLAVPQIGAPFSGEAVEAIIEGQTQVVRLAEAEARQILTRLCAEEGARLVQSAAPAIGLSGSLKTDVGRRASLTAARARLCDLVAFPPLNPPVSSDLIETFLGVLTQCGRPALVAPRSGGGAFAAHAAVAWDGSQSAANAARAALPWLELARSVDILCVGGEMGATALKSYLALHGARADIKVAARGEASVGETLVANAASAGADLLVMGGYGHSHLRETLLGGVTADVLSLAALPVLLAH